MHRNYGVQLCRMCDEQPASFPSRPDMDPIFCVGTTSVVFLRHCSTRPHFPSSHHADCARSRAGLPNEYDFPAPRGGAAAGAGGGGMMGMGLMGGRQGVVDRYSLVHPR